jgi:hypothetical protein
LRLKQNEEQLMAVMVNDQDGLQWLSSDKRQYAIACRPALCI